MMFVWVLFCVCASLVFPVSNCRRVVQMISLVNYEDCVSFTEGESRWYFRCSLEVTAV
jgi:hypothetical protein